MEHTPRRLPGGRGGRGRPAKSGPGERPRAADFWSQPDVPPDEGQEEGTVPEPRRREEGRQLGESQELLNRMEPLLRQVQGQPETGMVQEEGGQGEVQPQDEAEAQEGGTREVQHDAGAQEDVPAVEVGEVAGAEAEEEEASAEDREEEDEVSTQELQVRLRRLRSVSPEQELTEEVRQTMGVEQEQEGRSGSEEGVVNGEREVASHVEEGVVAPQLQEEVPPAQEEAAGPVQEGRQEVGHRARGRDRGRGGRGPAEGVRLELRAPNCLPLCPASCRGLGPTCMGVATPTRGTPLNRTPHQGRARGRGRGRGRGGASQSQPGSTQPPSPNSQDTVPVPADLPTLEEAHSTHIPTHKFPPKSVRAEFSRVLGALWNRMADSPEDVSVWVLESIFCRVILHAGQGHSPRRGDAYSQARAVRERLRRWRLGEYGELWDEALAATRLPPRARRTRAGGAVEKTLQEKNAERAAMVAQEGQYGKALQALTSAGMAEHTRETEEVMRSKHPPATGPSTFVPAAPVLDTPQLQFGLQEVEKAALSFRWGSAPGPGGLRPEHMRITVKGAPANRAARAGAALTRVVNLMSAGRVPAEVAPFLCGARLHAAKKKDGGLRPIAVGNLLRRLTSKLIAAALADKAAEHLSPHQLGVGVRGGCEAILHTVRQAVEKDPKGASG